MSSELYITGLCLLWILMCGRMWWAVGRQHAWQRRLIAIGAGIGAAMFYLLGTAVWSSIKKPEPAAPTTGEEIRVSPRVK